MRYMKIITRLLEHSRYLILVAVVGSLAAAVAAFGWGIFKTGKLLVSLAFGPSDDNLAKIGFLELMDVFLIATALIIFAIGLYELFFEDVAQPTWLHIHNLHDLKAKVSSVAILVMAITFLEHLVEWKDPQGTLFFGVAVAVVTAALIAFSHFGGQD